MNPIVGFRVTYYDLLQYRYHIPKETHGGITLHDIDNETFEWADMILEYLVEEKKEEQKRQEEENRKQQEEYDRQRQQYEQTQHMFSSGNLNLPQNFNY